MTGPARHIQKYEEWLDRFDLSIEEFTLDELCKISKSRYIDLRYQAAEIMGDYVFEESVLKRLISMLKDPSSHVRLAVACSLSNSDLEHWAEEFIANALASERDLYVKCYLILALSNFVTPTSRTSICETLNKAKRSALKLRCEYALYKLGDVSRLSGIISYLRVKDYRARSACVGILEEIYDAKCCEMIVQSLKAHCEIERVSSVKERTQRVLEKIKD
jgi:HEAT repeat protein